MIHWRWKKKSGGSFVVEQRATQCLCVWYSLFPLFFRKEGWDESDGRERKTETVKLQNEEKEEGE